MYGEERFSIMVSTADKLMPGTTTTFIERGEKGFSKIKMLLDATGGLSLSQVCAVTGLEGSTIQNWVKRGWVAHPIGKRYEEVHIARILIINALKECIKLEHIALLMKYVNGPDDNADTAIIKESELFNYLCEALSQSGQVDDHSRTGVESVVETVIKDYSSPNPDARVRIRKALTLMMFACVCTDVKRRTEAMMGRILHELENPEVIEKPVPTIIKPLPVPEVAIREVQPLPETDVTDEIMAIAAESAESRKTISQALREWDISSVERIIIDHNEEARSGTLVSEEEEKAPSRPWFVRKGSK